MTTTSSEDEPQRPTLRDAERDSDERAAGAQVQEGDGSPVNPFSEIPRPGDADLDHTPIADQT